MTKGGHMGRRNRANHNHWIGRPVERVYHYVIEVDDDISSFVSELCYMLATWLDGGVPRIHPEGKHLFLSVTDAIAERIRITLGALIMRVETFRDREHALLVGLPQPVALA